MVLWEPTRLQIACTKERNVIWHKRSIAHMKSGYLPGCHQNDFVATHAYHMPKCMGCHKAIAMITGIAH